jgi:hypothetical protein
MFYNISKDEADKERLLISNYFRNENNEMFSERNREGSFNTLIQKPIQDSC